MNILQKTIHLLVKNGEYTCPDCEHKAGNIEALVKVVEAAQDAIEEMICTCGPGRGAGRCGRCKLHKKLEIVTKE